MPALFDAVRSMHRKKSGQNQIAGIIVRTIDCECPRLVYEVVKGPGKHDV